MARFRMSSLVGFALALMMAAVPLEAQDQKGQGGGGGRPGGGFGGTMGGGFGQVTRLSLVGREQVANEIKLSPEEKTKIADLNKEIPSFRPAGNSKDLSQEERKKLATENMEKRAKATTEAEKKLDGILKPEQSKRLDEIFVQQRGIQALKDEKVAKSLKLSEEQVGKIDAAIKWGTEERTKLFQGQGGGGRPSKEALTELREKQEKLQKEIDGKVLASLTDAQKEQFEKMKGSPFTLERTGGRQGGPGGPGGGGGGGNRKGAKDA